LRISTSEDDRAGKFHSQVFERYSRYETDVAEALTQMFVSGVSTHKVGEVTQTLLGIAPNTVSRLNETLTEQYEAWPSALVPRKTKRVGVGGSQDLRNRGVSEIDLIVTDGHEGGFQPSPLCFRRPCATAVWSTNSRVLMIAIPKREQQEVAAELTGIFNQVKKEDAVLNLTAFKAKYHLRYPEAVRSVAAKMKSISRPFTPSPR
jgi:putative transposase